MKSDSEKQIHPKVVKCFESLDRSIQLFEKFLESGLTSTPAEYYKARNSLREGEKAYRDALKNAKKLLGPLPEYVTQDYQKWRDEFLEQHHILAKCQEYEDLRAELTGDEYLQELMTEEEIAELLHINYQNQQEGKRKLSNIKIRIILTKLNAKLSHAKELQKQALARQQNP